MTGKCCNCDKSRDLRAVRRACRRASIALAAGIAVAASGASAVAETPGLVGPEHKWLEDNFTGPFTWNFIDLETGKVTLTGAGDCEMIYGGLFLRCVHKSASGEELGVGISGYNNEKQKNQWTYYGAGSSAMLHGEGYRDAKSGESYIEGTQKIPGSPEFTFRTVTKKISDRRWSYSHYRLDGDQPVEMFRATFDYGAGAKK